MLIFALFFSLALSYCFPAGLVNYTSASTCQMTFRQSSGCGFGIGAGIDFSSMTCGNSPTYNLPSEDGLDVASAQFLLVNQVQNYSTTYPTCVPSSGSEIKFGCKYLVTYSEVSCIFDNPFAKSNVVINGTNVTVGPNQTVVYICSSSGIYPSLMVLIVMLLLVL